MKAWVEEYKKLNQNYKLEEKNLIHSFLKDDFHLNKIYSILLQDDVENERKTLEVTLKQLKLSINDVYFYFRGQNKIKNFDLRQKIYKIDEVFAKNRMEFKNKFENLMSEEEVLDRELNEFMEKFENKKEEIDSEIQSEETTDEIKQKNQPTKKFYTTCNDRIDEYISHIMNSANIVFDDYPVESIVKLIEKIPYSELELIKEKIKVIEQVIEKSLGGVNLTWQPRDHQDFLKLRASHNCKINSFDFLQDLENIIPFIPRTELKNHIKSYNKFSQLTNLKKFLLTQYKDLKNNQGAKEKKQILEKITEEKKTTNFSGINSQKEYEKEKLLEWKKKKLHEKKEKYEEQLRLEQEIKEKEKQKYIDQVNRNKSLLEEYNKRKSVEVSERIDQNKTQSQINFTEIDLERVRERNEKLAEKKMMIVKSKSLNLIKKAENYTKYKLKKMVKLDKMQATVTESTEINQIKKRKKHDYNKDEKKQVNTMANNVLGRMTRAIPEWRKGLI